MEWDEATARSDSSLLIVSLKKLSSLTIGLEVKKVCGITQANVVENLYHS